MQQSLKYCFQLTKVEGLFEHSLTTNYLFNIRQATKMLMSIFFHVCMCAKWLQMCLTLCDPVGRNPPGSSVHEILPVRILEWAAMSCSRGSSPPRDGTLVS